VNVKKIPGCYRSSSAPFYKIRFPGSGVYHKLIVRQGHTRALRFAAPAMLGSFLRRRAVAIALACRRLKYHGVQLLPSYKSALQNDSLQITILSDMREPQ
jgi:hypothetical protein